MSLNLINNDKKTANFNSENFPKDHPLMECLGTIDELNAFLGDAKSALADSTALSTIIEDIQKELYVVSGIIAGSPGQIPCIEKINRLISEIESKLPAAPSNFVVPGVNKVSAKLHICRTVCRRAERRLISHDTYKIISQENYNEILAWFNKLSHLLFLLAIYCTFQKNYHE